MSFTMQRIVHSSTQYVKRRLHFSRSFEIANGRTAIRRRVGLLSSHEFTRTTWRFAASLDSRHSPNPAGGCEGDWRWDLNYAVTETATSVGLGLEMLVLQKPGSLIVSLLFDSKKSALSAFTRARCRRSLFDGLAKGCPTKWRLEPRAGSQS